MCVLDIMLEREFKGKHPCKYAKQTDGVFPLWECINFYDEDLIGDDEE
jgi:uncharacterized protein YdeI (YjbR/CyaY-like superfamily)